MSCATSVESLRNLSGFSGGGDIHRYGFILITDGVKYLADKAGAFWLLDIINSYQSIARKDAMMQDYQIWHLRPGAYPGDKSKLMSYYKPEEEGEIMAHVVLERDTDQPAIVQDILYTDFPFAVLPDAKIIVEKGGNENGSTWTAMLPSER